MRQLHRWQYQYLGLTSLPRSLSVLERDAFFTFTPEDIAALQSRYKAALRIGAAIQLGFLRMTGRTLEGVRVVNPKLLTHVAAQLDVPPPSIASLKGIYRHRRRTLYEHQLWALKIAGFTRANDKQLAQLQFALSKDACHGLSVDVLVEFAKVWLYQHSFLIPADRLIRDRARQALAESEEGLLSLIQSLIPELTRRNWEKQLLRVRENSRKTQLEWLSEPPRKGNRRALTERVERIEFLRAMKVDQFPLTDIPIAKIRLYGEEMWHLRPAKFRELKDPLRTLRLICFLHWTLMENTDTALLMAGQQVTKLWGDAYTKAQLLEAKQALSSRDVVKSIFEMVDDATLSDSTFRERIRALKQQQQPAEFPTRAAAARHLLSETGTTVRPLLAVVEKLAVKWEPDHPAHATFKLLGTLRGKGQSILPTDTVVKTQKGWRPLVDGADRGRALRALEASALMELKKGLRNGQAWIDHSAAFRHRDAILISKERWKKDRVRLCKQLNQPLTADEFLTPIFDALKKKLKQVSDALTTDELSIRDGVIHVPRVKAERNALDIKPLRDRLFQTMGPVQLPDLILEVDSHTHFSQALLGRAPRSEEELLKVYAGMLAHATSFNATQIAQQMPQLTADQVLTGMVLFENAERVRAANATVVSYQRQLPVTRLWGDDKLASSDSMSVDVSRRLWNARLDPKRGIPSIGTYTHWVNTGGLIYDQPLVLGNRQAGAAIEGVVRQEEIVIDQLAVDTHGYTMMGIVISKFNGFDLCPRLKQQSERKLYLPTELSDDVPDSLMDIIDFSVSLKLIRQHWDDLLRIAASIATGQTNAMIALARFGSAATHDPIYRAGVALGRLLRSVYLCDYFISEPFRRVINRVLVHGEAIHRLQRAIYRGSFAGTRGQREAELIALSGSLTLVSNLCLAWTTTHIQAVLDEKPPWLTTAGTDWMKNISPGHFEFINLQGTLNFGLAPYRERLFATGAEVTANP